MQLVVVMAVRKAVAAATITFTAISIKRFFITFVVQCSMFNVQRFSSGPCRHRGYRHRQCCHLRFLRVPNREQIDFVDRYYRAKRDETENARK